MPRYPGVKFVLSISIWFYPLFIHIFYSRLSQFGVENEKKTRQVTGWKLSSRQLTPNATIRSSIILDIDVSRFYTLFIHIFYSRHSEFGVENYKYPRQVREWQCTFRYFRTNATISRSKICVIDLNLILPTFHSHFLFTPLAIWGWKWKLSPSAQRKKMFF